MARIDVNPIIRRNVTRASQRAAARYIDQALGTPKLWGPREYLDAVGDIPEGYYVIYTKFTREGKRDYYFGEIANKVLGGVQQLKFMTLYRKSSVAWLFHNDAGTLLWGPHLHPQTFLRGGDSWVPEEDYSTEDRDEDEEV